LLCRPGGGSAIRTVMAIAERMPESAAAIYQNVLEKTNNRLADYLAAQRRAGRPCDRGLRARGVANSWKSARRRCSCRFVFQAAPAPSAERIDEAVESAVRMFLAAYRAKAD